MACVDTMLDRFCVQEQLRGAFRSFADLCASEPYWVKKIVEQVLWVEVEL